MDLSSLPNYPSGKGVRWVKPPTVNRDFSRRGELLMKFLVLLAVLAAVFYLRWRLLPAGTIEANQREMIIGNWETEEDNPMVMEFTQSQRFVLFAKNGFIICQGSYHWEGDEIEVTELRNWQGEKVWAWEFQGLDRERIAGTLRFKATVTPTELMIAEPAATTDIHVRRVTIDMQEFNLPPRIGNVLKLTRKQ